MSQDLGSMVTGLLLAIFGIPYILPLLSSFDPLLLIITIFAVVAGLQHLGITTPKTGTGDEDASTPNGSGRSSAHGERETSGSNGSRRRGRRDRDSEISAKDLLAEAEQCLEQNSWKRVQEIARKVTDADPENARAWELLATAQKWEGKRSEAQATVKKATEVYEVESEGLKKLAKELEALEDPDAVATENEKRGADFMAQRQYDLAIDCFNKAVDALDSGPSSQDVSRSVGLKRKRAECAQQLQDWGLCRRDATCVLEHEPNDKTALLQRAVSNEAMEKFSAALDDARRLIALDPKNVAANRVMHNCRKAL